MEIVVAARSSPLSKVQYQEVYEELLLASPHIVFKPIFIKTYGDLDRTTSLRSLVKTNFFTKDLDELLLAGKCRIAIHSAKDLPEPIPNGISLIALTKGVDSSDSLVLREGESLQSLPAKAVIATSSAHREEAVKQLKEGFCFVDLRGTIEERLAKLQDGSADGVVVAEAALIRLKLAHLNRVTLPGETTPLQGQLAILAQSFDHEMAELFAPLDSRKK